MSPLSLQCNVLVHFLTGVILFCLGWMGVPLPVGAQTEETLLFSHIGIKQGLLNGNVFAMHQDVDGLIWMGTASGLFRWDGRRFLHFTHDLGKPDSLSAAYTLSIFEQGGALWVGTDRGLDRLDLESYRIERMVLPDDLPKNNRRVLGMAPRDEGSFWVASAAALLIFDWRERRFTIVNSGETGTVRGILSDGHGGVWYSKGSHVIHVDLAGRRGASFDLAANRTGTAQLERIAHHLKFDAQQRIWVLMHKGVTVLEVQAGDDPAHPAALGEVKLPELVRLQTATTYDILRDSDGDMWIACTREMGLWRWSARNGELQSFTNDPSRPDSLSINTLASLLQDRSGVLWVGTWGDGVNLTDLKARGFSSYKPHSSKMSSLSRTSGSAVLRDETNHVWVGSTSEALSRVHLSTGQIQRFKASEVGESSILTLAPADHGRIWVGGESGLTLFDPRNRSFKRIDLAPDSPRGASIIRILQDNKGRLWAGSFAGLYRFDAQGRRRTFRESNLSSGLLSEVVGALLQDIQGRIWIGSKQGLHIWDEQRDRFVPIPAVTDDGQPDSPIDILYLVQASDGKIWVGTDRGLYQLVQKSESFELQDQSRTLGLPKSWTNAIVEDDSGQLWLGTRVGLIKLKWMGHTRVPVVRIFPLGFRHVGKNFFHGAVDRADDGSLIFGNDGLLRVRPDLFRENTHIPSVVLSDVRIFNRSVEKITSVTDSKQGEIAGTAADTTSSGTMSKLIDLGIQEQLHRTRRIQLDHRDNMVSFEFSAMYFNRFELNRYKWKLQGFDSDWVEGRNGESLATYTNLNPGHYILNVKAANPDGSWGEDSDPSLSLEIVALPPWWLTWWAKLSTIVFALCALVLAHRWRTASLRRNQFRLEGLVAKRTDDLLTKQRELQIQVELTERAHSEIADLSEMGRELGSSLDIEVIVTQLHKQLRRLIGGEFFSVGLVDLDSQFVNFEYVFVYNRIGTAYRLSLSASDCPAVQCVSSGLEIIISNFSRENRVVDWQPEGEQAEVAILSERPLMPLSGIYVPLRFNGKVGGVITALNMEEGAYSAHDVDILRTLGAYAAVALDNARAYSSLEASQRKLVEQEKLAALGSLVAGVAHELNTPIGNSLLIASTLRDGSREFSEKVEGGKIRRSDLSEFCETTQGCGDVLVRALGQAARLVQSFKQLAVDQTSEQRRCFDLQVFCGELMVTLGAQIRQSEHNLVLDVPTGLLMDSYPGPLGQVIGNMVLNSIVHGFDGRKNGEMRLVARELDGAQITLIFSDNGAGIAARHLVHVFEPFYTTRLGQGGSGLGLHICYNIVTGLLGGQISVHSEEGKGAQFKLTIPRVAP